MLWTVVGITVMAIILYVVMRRKAQSVDKRFIIMGEREQMGVLELILNPPGRPKVIEIMKIPEGTKREMIRAFSSYDFTSRYKNFDLICCCFNDNVTLTSQEQKNNVLEGFSKMLDGFIIMDMPK